MRSYPYSNPFETDSFLLQKCYTEVSSAPTSMLAFLSPLTHRSCVILGRVCCVGWQQSQLEEMNLAQCYVHPHSKFPVSTQAQKPQRKPRQQKATCKTEGLREKKKRKKKSICIGHLKPVFFRIKKMHVQLKAKRKFYRKKETAQAKLENAVCSAVGESVYIKHINFDLPLWTASIFMPNSCFSLSQCIELRSFC